MGKKVQISFAGDANLTTVRTQLEEIVKNQDYERFYCAFLPRHIVEQKGYSTEIVDMLEEIFGDKLEWVMQYYRTFETCITNMNSKREYVANAVDTMIICNASHMVTGVAFEKKLFKDKHPKGEIIEMP